MPLPALSFQSVNKTYTHAQKSHQALIDVSMNIEAGEFVALLGPNGAGKSTLINILGGLVKASQGKVEVMGFDVRQQYTQARRSLGIVPQELVFDPFFTVRECLVLQSGYFGLKHNHPWIDELLFELGLSDKAHCNMRQLSGGMKRRVLVAQALVHRPSVIVLDEPTAGVDVELRQTLWQFIAKLNRQGHTVLLTTHYLEEAESLCNRIAMLKEGRLIAIEKTSDLLHSTSSTMLRFQTHDHLPDSLHGKARRIGKSVQIKAHDAIEVEQILATLRTHGITVNDLEITRADLEDVFLEWMQKSPLNHPIATHSST